jgi:pimeloyl-ACP methyl ester carboxylesterase
MGGVVAVSFANRHPARARSLILIDPAFAVTKRMPFPLGVPGVAAYGITILAPSLPASQSADFLHAERRLFEPVDSFVAIRLFDRDPAEVEHRILVDLLCQARQRCLRLIKLFGVELRDSGF